MSELLMRGVTHVRDTVASYLSDAMPKQIDLAREQWNLQDWQLPYPVKYDSYDPLMMSDYPTVGSVVVRTTNFKRNDYDATMAEQYQVRYAVRAFLWARTLQTEEQTWQSPTYDSALKARDDLGAILRSTLLSRPSFGTTDNAHGDQMKMEESSLSEEYFDAIKMSEQNDRWIAGISINFDLDVTESLWRPALNNVDTVNDVGNEIIVDVEKRVGELTYP